MHPVNAEGVRRAAQLPTAPQLRRWLALLLAVAVGLKLALLFTSQSMADGDEAVTGLMAVHVLEHGIRPIYPYGVQYGAGAGLEIHLAALLFAVFGDSDIALKAAALPVWLATLALVHATALRMAGPWAGFAAALLYGFAPQAAEWSLKVCGGHSVGVLIALGAVYLIERGAPRVLAAALLPLAVVAHPTVAALCGALAGYLLWTSEGAAERIAVLLSLAVAGALVAFAFQPPETGIGHPATTALDPAGLFAILPVLVAGIFSPNLNTREMPALPHLLVSIVWLVALAVAALRATGRPRRWLYLLAPLGMLVVVRATEVAPRHLLVLYPIGCIVLAVGLAALPARRAVLAALVLGGAAVQVHVMFDPVVHGAGAQGRGILRANVLDVVRQLEESGVGHVYSADPMLQWNLAWVSRERVVARWIDPVDRIPGYPERVDQARRAGLPIAVVAKPWPEALAFRVFPPPADAQLERIFPPADGARP